MAGRSRKTAKRNKAKSKRPSNALAKAQQQGVTLELAAWSLDPPPIEYHADLARLEVVSGIPTVYFVQRMPGGSEIMNGIGIRMPPQRFKATIATYKPVVDALPRHLSAWPQVKVPKLEILDGLGHGNFRMFAATMTRGGCGDEWAMIDFYNVELIFRERVRPGTQARDFVSGAVRVFLSPPVFAQLMDEAFELIAQWD